MKETLNKEADLLGDGRPSTYKYYYNDRQAYKHDCYKASYRDPKLVGNMIMPQYLTKIFKPHIELAQ